MKRSFFVVPMFFLVCFNCGEGEPGLDKIIRPVRYMEVYSTGGSRLRTFAGTAQSGVQSNLSFKVAGTVESVPVKVGDRVRRGDVIARIDATDYELQVQQANAALSQARAQYLKANADYERIRQLYESKSASKSELDAARAAYESTTASVEAAEKQLELARLQLSYTRLTAPTDGSIASVYVEANENVKAGQTVVMMTAGQQIEVEVAIPEILISQIRAGERVTVNFDAIPRKTYSATIREVGVASTSFATTFPVTVELDDPDEDIRSGMAAEVAFKFESDDRRERFLVPAVAVGEDREGRFVYTVRPVRGDTAVVQRREVEIGELSSDGLEIFSGLSDGDLVVTAGVSKIQDGQEVRLR